MRSFFIGEIPGMLRFIICSVAALAIWVAAFFFTSDVSGVKQSYALQQRRYQTLIGLAEEYRALVAGSGVTEKTAESELVAVFSQIVEDAGLRDKLLQISPATRGISVQLDRLYMEEFTMLLAGLKKHGIRVISSEIRALPAQNDRLFSFFAMLGVEA